MKKRNLVIVAFMLVAAMTIGVGYAALSANLMITGTAILDLAVAEDQITENVYISAGTAQCDGTHLFDKEGNEITNYSYADKSLKDFSGEKLVNVSFAVNTLAQIGQQVTFTYTITNDSSEGVEATVLLDGNLSQAGNCFGAKIAWSATQPDGTTVDQINNTAIIPSNSTAAVTIVVTLEDLPEIVDENNTHIEETFSFTLAATVSSD